MALDIEPLVAAAGGAYFVTLQKQSTNEFWNVTAQAWQANPALADRRINLSPGTGAYATRYTAEVSGLGDDGLLSVAYHDDNDANDAVIAGWEVFVHDGAATGQPGSEIITVEVSATEETDWGILPLKRGVDNRILFSVTGSPTPDLTTWTGLALPLKRRPDLAAIATLTIANGGLVVQPTTSQVQAIITAAHVEALSDLHKTILYSGLHGSSGGYHHLTNEGKFRVTPTVV
jgi:hypothetical protein